MEKPNIIVVGSGHAAGTIVKDHSVKDYTVVVDDQNKQTLNEMLKDQDSFKIVNSYVFSPTNGQTSRRLRRKNERKKNKLKNKKQ